MSKNSMLLERLANNDQISTTGERLIETLEVEKELKSKLVETAKQQEIDTLSDEAADELQKIANQLLETMNVNYNKNQKMMIIDRVIDEMLGIGPLEPLLADDTITEIMVNGPNKIFIERKGEIERVTQAAFKDEQHIKDIIDRIVAKLGRRIDTSEPKVDARLPDGSRVNASIPPIAIDGPNITIRKFAVEKMTVEDLYNFGSINKDIVHFLKAVMIGRKNVIVSGGTGSGKTTFLNIVSDFIPLTQRIITIEDSAELQLKHSNYKEGNIIRMEAKNANVEGKGEITIHDLVVDSLRKRPDRIIVGECRGDEAVEMISAFNTGHPGSLSTVHANSAEKSLLRLENMIARVSSNVNIQSIRQDLGSAIDIIVQLSRLEDGTRKTMQVLEVVDYDYNNDEYELNPLFEFRRTGKKKIKKIEDGEEKIKTMVTGDYVALGNKPSFLEEFKMRDIPLDENIFQVKK
jgi:pilus assembly protein CpaF